MSGEMIPFNRPYVTGKEFQYISEAQAIGDLTGDGRFAKNCHRWIEQETGAEKALLTHSCTAALEMAALLLKIQPGDEVIMPSYTFVSTANAFVLRGAVPVFVDIREDTLNLDESLIEEAITSKTKVIVPVHYAGVACEMDEILAIASQYKLKVVEDAAQGILASYKGRALGSIGDLGAYSFHETKNIISGEGGALLVNDVEFVQSAEIVREKGTDRSRFHRGELDKYTWQDLGSSYLPSEITSAFLWAQLEEAKEITSKRLELWNRYDAALSTLKEKELLECPIIPDDCQHNGHMYYVLLPSKVDRQKVLNVFRENEINSVFHYVPLHSSPAGRRFGRVQGSLEVTDKQSSRLIRLPFWVGLTHQQQERVVEVLNQAII